MSNQGWFWVRQDVVLAVHNDQIARHGGSEGLRDAGGLESALAYPQNLAAYGDPGLAELAAGYLFAVAKNHAFVDGNKRTAWVTCNIFIEINGGELVFDKLEAVRFVEGVAGGTIDYDGARWIAARLTESDPQD
jgi:death-on-curing protein